MADNPRIVDLRRRVEKDPASIAFAQLAEELRRAGAFQEAVDICRAGLQIHSGYLSARVTLGRTLIELNRLDEAQTELERVLHSAPENLAAIRGVAEIHHRRGELGEALGQYRAALVLAKNDPDLQQTVNDLSRQVEPPVPVAGDGLTFEQVRHELLKHAPAPKPAPPQPQPPSVPPPPVAAQSLDDAARERATRTIDALEQWVTAVHVARAERQT
jgi:tetratricopeptide (TPR) repeat protein